jgi:hypothetical protein
MIQLPTVVSIFIAAFYISLCHAFIVPTDVPDGGYRVSLDANGNALGPPILLELAEDQEPSINITTSLNKRQPNLPLPEIHCRDYKYYWADFEVARDGLRAWCDKGEYIQNTAMWWTKNSAITYFCAYGYNRCWRNEFDQANSLMDIACNANVGGWVYIPSYDKSYGKDNAGTRICW